MRSQRITALVGAQFGSEGKGLIASKIADRYDLHIRTGAPNAGHTYFVRHDGKPVKVVARSVPVGACVKDAILIIGPGALLDAELLVSEVAELDALGLGVSDRIFVDPLAILVDPKRHHAFEGGVEGEAHKLIGSTGEGVGPARMAKIARGTIFQGEWTKVEQVQSKRDFFVGNGITVTDTAEMVNRAIDEGRSVLLEGTQGSGLSLVHGPWPYTTSTDTNAGQLAVDAGIAPQLVTDVLLVARTHPIRVAGNSGPLPHEMTWEELGRPEERTTVTKKVRRVGGWSDDTVMRAVMLNRPSAIALTFVDYWNEQAAGVTEWGDLPDDVVNRVHGVESRIGVKVLMVGTGPNTVARNSGGVHGQREVYQTWPLQQEAYWSGVETGVGTI
jgi:adenylosuccinate synthase